MDNNRVSNIRNKNSINKIEVKSIKTCYHYPEYYWIIDDKPIVEYLDEYMKKGLCPELSSFGSMLGLMPAWTGELLWKWENDFIWELIDSKEELNVPILVCEDDCDLSCIVIIVKIRKSEDYVYWDKIGSLNHQNGDLKEEQKSGILCLEAYTEEDWELYGDNIALEEYGSSAYWKWIQEHSYEEHIRRLRNYLKPYMQSDENIDWMNEIQWKFDRNQYNEAVSVFRNLYNMHKETSD